MIMLLMIYYVYPSSPLNKRSESEICRTKSATPDYVDQRRERAYRADETAEEKETRLSKRRAPDRV